MPTVNDKTKAAMERAAAVRKQATPADIMYMKLNNPDILQSIENALPSAIKKDAKRFSRILMTLVRQSRGLAECELSTVLGGALTGAAWLTDAAGRILSVPLRTNRGKTGAVNAIGYKGIAASSPIRAAAKR